jgi:hypothetical protein
MFFTTMQTNYSVFCWVAKFRQIVKNKNKREYSVTISFFPYKAAKCERKIEKFQLQLDSDFCLIAFLKT